MPISITISDKGKVHPLIIVKAVGEDFAQSEREAALRCLDQLAVNINDSSNDKDKQLSQIATMREKLENGEVDPTECGWLNVDGFAGGSISSNF